MLATRDPQVVGESRGATGKSKLDVPAAGRKRNNCVRDSERFEPMTSYAYVKSIHVFNEKKPAAEYRHFPFGPARRPRASFDPIRLAGQPEVAPSRGCPTIRSGRNGDIVRDARRPAPKSGLMASALIFSISRKRQSAGARSSRSNADVAISWNRLPPQPSRRDRPSRYIITIFFCLSTCVNFPADLFPANCG